MGPAMEWVADHSRVLMALFALGCLGFAVWSANVDRTQSGDIEGLGLYIDQRIEDITAQQEAARVATDLGTCERANVSRQAIRDLVAQLVEGTPGEGRANELAAATLPPVVCAATIQTPP